MAPESKEPYHPIIWQLICCPFTPFLILFCEILSTGRQNSGENSEALAAMERLPSYLKEISSRNSFAAGLEETVKVFVQHARCVIDHPDHAIPDAMDLAIQGSTMALENLPHNRPSEVDMHHSASFASDVLSLMPTTLLLETSDFNGQLDGDLAMFTTPYDQDALFGLVEQFTRDQWDQFQASE